MKRTYTNKTATPALRGKNRRRGATLVEFALVAPIFFLSIFAGIEFAVLNTIRATSHNAAYEAARKLVIPGAAASEGITEANRIMGVIGVDSLKVTVTPNTIAEDTKQVTVDISIPYADNAIFMPFFTGNVTLQSSITMATERYDGIVAGP